MLARENRAEEHKPWLSIKIRDPYHPHNRVEISPAVKIPMCPTEE